MCMKQDNVIGGILLCIGFLLVAGTIGGIEGGEIDLIPGTLMCIIGFILSGFGIDYADLTHEPVMGTEKIQEETNETERV